MDDEDVLLDRNTVGASRSADLGAPLLSSNTPTDGGAGASYIPSTLRRRRLWFDNVFGVVFGVFAFVMTLLALTIGVKAVVNRRTPAVVMLDEGTSDIADPTHPGTRHVTYEGFKLFTGLMLICTLGVVLSALWMQLMVTCAPALLTYTLMAVALLGLFGSAAFLAGANPWAGVITLLVTLTALVYFQQFRRRMAFATANLKVACRALWDSTPLLGVGLGLLLLQVGWGVLWALALVGAATNADLTTLKDPVSGTVYSMSQCTTYETLGPNANFTSTCVTAGEVCMKCVCGSGAEAVTMWEGRVCFTYKLYAGWLVVLLLGFLWGCSVIRNVGHCCVAGTVGTWWVSGGERASSSVGPHFRRAITTSFGSICLGSLLVAIVQTTRHVLLNAHRANQRTVQSNTITAMLSCVLVVVDRALAWFNRYALVYVALYGLDFMSAGKATTELFKARGVSALVNDTLIEGVLTLGTMIVGLLCALVGWLYGRDWGLSQANIAILGVSGAFIGVALAGVVAGLVESSVCTTFVLFAEDPQSLEISHGGAGKEGEMCEELMQAWEDVLQGPLSGMGGMMGGGGGREGGREGFRPPTLSSSPSPFAAGAPPASGKKNIPTPPPPPPPPTAPIAATTSPPTAEPQTAVEKAVANFGGGSSLLMGMMGGSGSSGGSGGERTPALDVSEGEQEEEEEEDGEREEEVEEV
ncbi:choline transporter [Nannochloropsis oceanica]